MNVKEKLNIGQRWLKLLEHLADLKILTFLPPRHDIIMLMKHADGYSDHNKYWMK